MELSASVGAAVMIDASLENPPSGDLISKIDTAGNIEWTVEYQGGTQPPLNPIHIIETEDGAYVLADSKIALFFIIFVIETKLMHAYQKHLSKD